MGQLTEVLIPSLLVPVQPLLPGLGNLTPSHQVPAPGRSRPAGSSTKKQTRIPCSRCTSRRTGAARHSAAVQAARERRHPRLVQLALGRALHDPANTSASRSARPPARRARAAQPPRRPPHPRSARATSRDVSPRPKSWRRESGQLADAYRSRVLVSPSLQGGAGPAREGDRPTQVRGGELTTGTRPSASYRGERGSSGSPSGRGEKPDGDTVPAAAGAHSGVFPGCWPGITSPRAQGPGPVSLLASVTQPSHR